MDNSLLDKIWEMIIKQDDKLDSIDKNQVIHSEILEEHSRRSLASEKRHDIIEKKVLKQWDTIASHLKKIEGIILFAKITVGLATFILVIVQIIKVVKSL